MASAISSARSPPGRTGAAPSLPSARLNALVVFLLHSFAPVVKALPVVQRAVNALNDEEMPKSPQDANLWAYLGTAIALVLLGGAFAGLTIA